MQLQLQRVNWLEKLEKEKNIQSELRQELQRQKVRANVCQCATVLLHCVYVKDC